jgi:Uma2 family endonuclease
MINDVKPMLGSVIYPDSDGQPMTESDATRHYLLYCVETLRLYFRSRQNIYVSGNLFIYYEEGNNNVSISPDVFVIFGVSNRDRRSYKTWEEGGKLPSFILEVTSRTTKRRDEVEKPALYASLGVAEYFQYDPTGDYLKPQLKASRLVDGTYQSLLLQWAKDGTSYIHSTVLGLDLQLQSSEPSMLAVVPLPQELRFYDPQTGLKLLSREELEQAKERVEQERDAAMQERDAAVQEALRLAERLRELGVDLDQP